MSGGSGGGSGSGSGIDGRTVLHTATVVRGGSSLKPIAEHHSPLPSARRGRYIYVDICRYRCRYTYR
jgi:hypothetical protein